MALERPQQFYTTLYLGNRYDLIDTSKLPQETNPSMMGWYEIGTETFFNPETNQDEERDTLLPTEDEEINPEKYYYGFCPNERIIVKDSDTTVERDYYIERIFQKEKLVQYNYDRNPMANLAIYEGDEDLGPKLEYDPVEGKWNEIKEPKKEYPKWPEWNVDTPSMHDPTIID